MKQTKNAKDTTKKYTMIDDPKPDEEIVDDIAFDIELIIDWWYKRDKDIDADVKSLMKVAKCNNTIHGLQILKKITMIFDDVDLPDDFILGVALHDVVKWKKRNGVINGIMDKYVGAGRWVDTGDHGINGGFLISALFKRINIRNFNFVFMHTKDRPFELDPNSWYPCEIAFFIFDDLIRDSKKYKTKLPKDQYDQVHQYFQHPDLENTMKIFNILKEYHHSSKN